MPRANSLAGLRFALVGAGRVGTSLGHWLTAAGATAARVASRSGERVAGIAARLGAQVVSADELTSDDCALLLVTVPDGAVPQVATQLAARPQAPVAWHCAGALDASVLAPLADRGAAVGGFHPLIAFPRSAEDVATARGVVFGVDGHAEAVALARRVTAAWEATTVEVPAAARLAYHFAATLAAGNVLTLLALAEELASGAGLGAAVGTGYRRLAATALAAAEGLPAAAAITGPVVRGDRDLVLAELRAVRDGAPPAASLALLLARETLRQLALRQPLTASQRALAEALREPPVG